MAPAPEQSRHSATCVLSARDFSGPSADGLSALIHDTNHGRGLVLVASVTVSGDRSFRLQRFGLAQHHLRSGYRPRASPGHKTQPHCTFVVVYAHNTPHSYQGRAELFSPTLACRRGSQFGESLAFGWVERLGQDHIVLVAPRHNPTAHALLTREPAIDR